MKLRRTLAALLAWALALAPASADIYPPAGSGALATGATNLRVAVS